MVQTRAGTLAAGAGKAAARSFSQAFPAIKPNVASSSSSSSSSETVAKVASKRARTVVATTKTVSSGGPSSKASASRGRGKVSSTAPTTTAKADQISTKAKGKTIVKKEKAQDEVIKAPVKMLPDAEAQLCTTIDRPELTFSVEAALDHLCAYDVRFEQVRHKVGLRTFTSSSPQPLNLFQTLVISILGQQISWLAARSILYKFTRIWWADSLPERPDWDNLARNQLPFPTPRQVYETTEAEMRTAGLSFSKIRYVQGLAEMFGTGAMDVRELVAMEDEQALIQMLCAIKGVGVWTAQMTLMFALRKPDILSHADLGIQKGMVIWHLAGPEGPTIRSETRKQTKTSKKADAASSSSSKKEEINEALADASTQTTVDAVVSGDKPVDIGLVSGAEPKKEEEDEQVVPKFSQNSDRPVPPLPADSDLTMRILQDRRNGKKVKGAYLTPAEMNSLARAWHPYESIASLFMWSLVD
ncbi:unnamed protein product [Tilletia controversa]|uniref:HhH-GPD domain-containing protein n=3 Tax=Tilletia TaxID=13289 RepID=A0A8X7MSN2_9BASI|nr:hypothetical protein CF336_g4194 [Tilletia laevis]KAE8197344.1 hypothetical protein CF328_g3879 [Tilletia controversa]KAE8261160.1 hypothetical protein A4X03_0g3493 [Tilletia caries]KAE8205185.1 hypothetical protein CF335_g2389 [Tilletia laevis]KAE8247281.1 hypothetical protein A4X06_0g4570 [Tilletia controversa]